MPQSRRPPLSLCVAPLFGLAALALARGTGGLSASFLDPDESAHYVNTLFLADWLRAGCPAPLAYARDFYAHFPKLSIGHWPPGWYALLAPGWAVVRPSPAAAAVFSAFVAGLPAALIVWALDRAGARAVGIVAGLAYLLSPLVAEEARFFRLDQPVALVAGIAAIAWTRAAERPSLPRYLLFGALAATATLTKGNGALVMLVPAFEIALARRWRQLADWRLWVAAIATLIVVAPWYAISFRISAGGFNYAPGFAYARLSLAATSGALLHAVGIPGVALATVGAVTGWRRPAAAMPVRIALATILATLVFQAAIPVALEDRYALPALPWLVALAALGLRAVARRSAAPPFRAPLATALAGLLIAPLAAETWGKPPKPDMAAPALAADMVRRPGIWLVDGRAGGEGAVIAAAAYADRGRRAVWAARASQWLSASDFMGRGYRLTVHSPAQARAMLDRLGVRGVVSIAERGRPAYPHSALLRRAVRLPGFAVIGRPFAAGPGNTLAAIRRAPVTPRPALLAPGSDRAAAMGAAL